MKSLAIVGIGVRSTEHLTLSALQKMKDADIVLLLSNNEDEIQSIVPDAKIENILDLYHDGAKDLDNYERILGRVHDALDTYQKVCFAFPGHPWIGVSTTAILQDELENSDTKVEVVDGVSSLNCMFSDLGRDPLEKGSLIIDVNRMLLFETEIDPQLDIYIYHVCSIGTATTDFSDPAKTSKIGRLKSFLLRHFPEDHEVKLIKSSEIKGEKSVVKVIPLKELESLLPELIFSSTLFVPGLEPSRYSEEFWGELNVGSV